MYQIKITEKEAGQRLDKYLFRILPRAGSGFLYKMLRKKNITLNDKKADGGEKITEGDLVTIYFSDETLEKFMGRKIRTGLDRNARDETLEIANYTAAFDAIQNVRILYENDYILLADKPAGVLSQKAEKTDISLNEWLIGYLIKSGAITEEELAVWKPSVCNRLDRNTSGIVLCSKTLKGAQLLSGLLKNRTLHKYYRLYVKGVVSEEQLIEGYLIKDEKLNKVYIESVDTGSSVNSANPQEEMPENSRKRYGVRKEMRSIEQIRSSYIKTGYKPVKTEHDKTLLEVELITGKTHQIRAHLASVGHPLLGDYKYGDKVWNDEYREKYQVRAQLLHAYKVVFPELEGPFEDISGRTFTAELPEIFVKVADDI